MLDAYTIAELGKIFTDGTQEITRQRITAEEVEVAQELARVILPQLDSYFSLRLGVEKLKLDLAEKSKELEALGNDKAFNDKDYLELSGKYNAAVKTIEAYSATVDILLSKLQKASYKGANA